MRFRKDNRVIRLVQRQRNGEELELGEEYKEAVLGFDLAEQLSFINNRQ